MQQQLTLNLISMTRITRVSMTLPKDLLNDFDDVITRMGYSNRSKAIQDAVRGFVSEHKWLQEEEGKYAGVLMMLYDHEVKGLEHALTHVQHEYAPLIYSSMHVHITDKDCLEAIAVKGEASEIRRLHDELSTKKGVKIVKLMVIPI